MDYSIIVKSVFGSFQSCVYTGCDVYSGGGFGVEGHGEKGYLNHGRRFPKTEGKTFS